MTKRLNILFSRLFRLERVSRQIHPMHRLGRGELSTYHKTLAMHIAATTQSSGRGLTR
jgi:hypothetical protein